MGVHPVTYRYRIDGTNYVGAREALARAMETVERMRDLDFVAQANSERPAALAALERGEPWLLGSTVLITPVP